MPAFRTLTAFPRWLMLAVLLCVLAARVAVPSGWMPMVGANGGIVLAPCTGMGAMTMGAGAMGPDMAAMDGMAHAMPDHAMNQGDHDGQRDGSQQHGDHPCSGAGVSAGLETHVIAAPLPFAATHAVAVATTLPVSIGRGLAAPPPPATGPPAFV